MKFKKRPIVIEAVHYTGTPSSFAECMMFIQDGHSDFKHLPPAPDDPHVEPGIGVMANGEILIPTLEGTMTCRPGDWIIRGVKGEVYPCKSDIFEATYEPA